MFDVNINQQPVILANECATQYETVDITVRSLILLVIVPIQ